MRVKYSGFSLATVSEPVCIKSGVHGKERQAVILEEQLAPV